MSFAFILIYIIARYRILVDSFFFKYYVTPLSFHLPCLWYLKLLPLRFVCLFVCFTYQNFCCDVPLTVLFSFLVVCIYVGIYWCPLSFLVLQVTILLYSEKFGLFLFKCVFIQILFWKILIKYALAILITTDIW